ncbi:3895_t:CDS:2, partial [Ambispora leptoticha]
GPVWSEYVAKDLKLELVNYAYGVFLFLLHTLMIGRLKVIQEKCDPLVPGLLQQVSQFLQDFLSTRGKPLDHFFRIFNNKKFNTTSNQYSH